MPRLNNNNGNSPKAKSKSKIQLITVDPSKVKILNEGVDSKKETR